MRLLKRVYDQLLKENQSYKTAKFIYKSTYSNQQTKPNEKIENVERENT